MNYPVLPRPRFSARLVAALRRFFLRDAARRDAADIAMGIVPTSRRHDRALVAAMQREAMEGGAK